MGILNGNYFILQELSIESLGIRKGGANIEKEHKYGYWRFKDSLKQGKGKHNKEA